MAKASNTCTECGDQLPVGSTRRRRYCSRPCADKASDRSRHSAQPTAMCNSCGKSFRPKRPGRDTACSRECGWAWLARKAELRRSGGRVSVVVKLASCANCSKRFIKSGAAKLCSDDCRKERARIDARKKSAARHDEEQLERKCGECGKVFSPKYGEKRRVFCSEPCARRAVKRVARRKERARLRGAKVEAVNPTKVFERDGWRCQLCGIKTPRRLRGSIKPNAPEMDHIIPLSKGGEHSYLNTQCACRQCNGDKGDSEVGQLRLFGGVEA